MKKIRENTINSFIDKYEYSRETVEHTADFGEHYIPVKEREIEPESIYHRGVHLSFYNEAEIVLLLQLSNYSPSRYFISYRADGKVPQQGWKTHISITTYDDYLFVLQVVLPEIREIGLSHKIVRPDELDDFNRHKTQAGKIITIYPDNLDFLIQFSPKVKEFLLEDNRLRVPTDKHLGGKVYARYVGYRDDYVTNPKTGERECIPRIAGLYKPNWVEEPPTLEEIFLSSKETV